MIKIKIALIKAIILIGKVNLFTIINKNKKESDKKVSQNKVNLQMLKLIKQFFLIRLTNPALAPLLYLIKNPFEKL